METKNKISFSDFVRQVAKKTGFAQKNINEIFTVGSECVAENLNNEIATTIMKGIIVYPCKYPAVDREDENGNIVHCDEVIYPRARFGQSFKKQLLFSQSYNTDKQ